MNRLQCFTPVLNRNRVGVFQTARFQGRLYISEDIKKHGKTPAEGQAIYQYWDSLLSPFRQVIDALPETFLVTVNAVKPDLPDPQKASPRSSPKFIEELRILYPTTLGERVDYCPIQVSVYENQQTGQLSRYDNGSKPMLLQTLFEALKKEVKRLGILPYASQGIENSQMMAKAYVSASVIHERMVGLMYHPDNYTKLENHYNRVAQALSECQDITERFPEGATFRIRGEVIEFGDLDKLELVLSDPLIREETVVPLGQYCVYQDVGDRWLEVEFQNPTVEQEVHAAVEKAKVFIETHFPGKLLPSFKEC